MTKIEELKKEVEDLQQRKAEVTRLIEEASSVRQDNVLGPTFELTIG
jgi:hypothetical protein